MFPQGRPGTWWWPRAVPSSPPWHLLSEGLRLLRRGGYVGARQLRLNCLQLKSSSVAIEIGGRAMGEGCVLEAQYIGLAQVTFLLSPSPPVKWGVSVRLLVACHVYPDYHVIMHNLPLPNCLLDLLEERGFYCNV